MNKGLLALNVILLAAVAVLFYLHFNSKKGTVTQKKVANKDSLLAEKPFSVAYFEMDSIQENTQLVKDAMAEMAKKESAINAELNRLGKNYQERVMFYQNKYQGKTDITQQEGEAAQKEIQGLEQNMTNRKNALGQEYDEFVIQKKMALKKAIEEYVKEYNTQYNYTYILSDDPGLFYFRDSSYNVTADIIRGLNEKYKANKK
jgi:outer membrane protein